MSKFNILVGITGSIAAYKTCSAISRWVKDGHSVQVLATQGALQFVGEASLEGLTGRKVATQVFSAGEMMDHIHWARWADVFVVAPVTAHHLGLFSNGLGEDLLSSVFLAFEKSKPILLAPAMNSMMWENTFVQKNRDRLAATGAKIIDPESGTLACGEVGPGRMIEPDSLCEEVYALLNTKSKPDQRKTLARPLRIIITYGGTREPIDGVRFITNMSSGETGRFIADELYKQGAQVTALVAEGARPPSGSQQWIHFMTHADLKEKLRGFLSNNHFDVLVHLAAVSDYSVEKLIYNNQEMDIRPDLKLSSQEENLTLKLKKNSKIINDVREFSKNRKLFVVGFKLTHSFEDQENHRSSSQLLQTSGADVIVHNDLTQLLKSGQSRNFTIFKVNAEPQIVPGIQGLSHSLWSLISEHTGQVDLFHSEGPRDFMS